MTTSYTSMTIDEFTQFQSGLKLTILNRNFYKAHFNRKLTEDEKAGFDEFSCDLSNHAKFCLEDNPSVEKLTFTFVELNEDCYEISQFVHADDKIIEFIL
jgi:hypothetical protein